MLKSFKDAKKWPKFLKILLKMATILFAFRGTWINFINNVLKMPKSFGKWLKLYDRMLEK